MARFPLILMVAAIAILIVASSSLAGTQIWTRQLAPGVTLKQIEITCDTSDPNCKPALVNAVIADPKVQGVAVKTVLAQDQVLNEDALKGREVVSSMVKRTGALAGTNGDYHNWIGDPDNVFIRNGELISDPWKIRPVFAVRSDGSVIMDKCNWEGKATVRGESCEVQGINMIPENPDTWQCIVFTPTFYKKTLTTSEKRVEAIIQTSDLPAKTGVPIKGKVLEVRGGNSPINPGTVVLSGVGASAKWIKANVNPGDDITITMSLLPRETGDWKDVQFAVGGCPWIVRNGKFFMDIAEERIEPPFYDAEHPRTMVGRTADGKVVLATVDGRQTTSPGMKLKDLAALMISLGCVEAINLDGGGSTEMAVQSGVLNSPSDGNERATATCLAIYSSRKLPSSNVPRFAIKGLPDKVNAGGAYKLSLIDAATGRPLNADLANKAIWTTDGRIGFVDLGGTFHALKAHSGKITAAVGSRSASVPVSVTSGGFSRLIAYFRAGKEADVSRLCVFAWDANANPQRWQPFTLKVNGGSVEKADSKTSDDGSAYIDVKWDGPASDSQQVEVRCGEQVRVVPRVSK